MFVNFSEETRHILKQAEKEKDILNHPYVGSEHLFLSILKESRLLPVFKRNKLTYDRFKNKLINIIGIGSKKSEFVLYTPLLKKIIEGSVIEAREENIGKVNPELLVISILNEEQGVAYTILKKLNINIDKLYFDIRNKKENKKIKHKKSLLDELGSDLTKLAKEKKLDPVIGRDKEIKKTIEILIRRKKNNPILIGPAGVGKTAIVEGIANLIASNKCPHFLKNKKIISLNMFSLVSGTKYRGEFEEKIKNVIKELEENENIILFIDEIHTMVGAGGAEGAIDASNIFKPALARGTIRIIGATTLDEYKKYIEPDAALSRRFQNILIEEPSSESVIKILTEIKPLYEKYHNIKVDDSLIKDIVNLTDKYLSNRFEPDRSIDVLDEVCARSSLVENYDERRKKKLQKRLIKVKKEKIRSLSKNDFKHACDLKKEENKIHKQLNDIKVYRKNVTRYDVIEVIKNKGNVSIIESYDNRKSFYKKLIIELNSVIHCQENNIDKLIKSLKKKELLLNDCCYSILITGPSGSGKTILAESFLKHLVKEKNIIRIDASEYCEYHMISKLIGTTAGYLGYDNKNNIFEKIRTNPNSAIIVDNFEDGCFDFQNLFMRILESGKIEDASGKTIDFKKSIIIFTSRTYNSINALGFSGLQKNDLSEISNRLANKVSVLIDMKPPDDESIKLIINDKLKELVNKYKYKNLNYDKDIINKIYEQIKDSKNLSLIDNLIENEFEMKFIDNMIDFKKSAS